MRRSPSPPQPHVNEASGTDGTFVLVARGASAQATGACSAAGPGLTGSSRVDSVLVNGQQVDVSQEQVETLPTGEVVHIRYNEQTRAGNDTIDAAYGYSIR